MTQMDAIKKLMQNYFHITETGELDYSLSGIFTIDQIDPLLASKLSEYLSYEQKRDRRNALKTGGNYAKNSINN